MADNHVTPPQTAWSKPNLGARYTDALAACLGCCLTETASRHHLPAHELHCFWSIILTPAIAAHIYNVAGRYTTGALGVFEFFYGMDRR